MQTAEIILEDPERLDRVVARLFKIQRSAAQAALTHGRVRVNGAMERRAAKLLRGAVTLELTPLVLPEGPRLVHLLDDPSFLVIDKPSGLLVHRVGQRRDTSVVDVLLAEGVPLAGGTGLRVGVVHRLDRDTSGAMLLAKDAEAHAELLRQFKEREVGKTYLAVVHGRMPAEQGTIDAPIAVGRDPSRRIVREVPGARPAQTDFRVVALLRGASVVELHPRTGRTHQIRAHLASLGHPVLGDALYGTLASRATAAPRLMLHARALEFTHPRTGRRTRVESPVPADVTARITSLQPRA